MWKQIKQAANFVVDVIYPRFCLECGWPGEFLCERCYSRLQFTLDDDLAPSLFKNADEPVYLSKVQALAIYDALMKKMMHNYKYLGVRDLGETFGFWLYEYTTAASEADVITYIPVHRKRLRERGYNQAEIVAKELARLSGVPCVELLKRPVYREKQALSKNKAERLTKTKDIFAPVENSLDRGKRILLVDDVVTTGATLNEAARVLREAGFERVSAVAIAHGE